MATTSPSGIFTIPRKPANSSTTALPGGLTAGEHALLAELQQIHAALSYQPIADREISSFKANTLLQFFGILAATIFGVFSILAWLAATKSNEISTNALNQALQSNQLAILAYCVSGNNTNAASICANVLSQASGAVAPIVASVLPNVPTSLTSSASSTTTLLLTSTTSTSFSVPPPLSTTTTSPRSTASGTTTGDFSATSVPSTTSALPTSTSSNLSASAAATSSRVPNAGAPTPGTVSPLSSVGSSNISSNPAAIIGGVVGAVAAIAAVFLYIWRRQAYKEIVRRGHAQEQEKGSEGM